VETWAKPHPEGTLLLVHAQPRASRTEVVGPYGEPARLKIKVAAPPVEGEANLEITAFIAKRLGVPKSRIHLLRGESSKQKDLLISGLEPRTVAQALQS
jgi:uncharacterized protein (TIGR00251 family)